MTFKPTKILPTLKLTHSCSVKSYLGRKWTISLRLDNHATLLASAVALVHILVEQQAAVSHPGEQHTDGEEEEREQTLPHLHNAWRDHGQDQVEPNVSEDTPGGCDEEDAEVLDLPRLAIGHDVHTKPDDDKHVERSRTHNSGGAQRASMEPMTYDFNDGQQDFRS